MKDNIKKRSKYIFYSISILVLLIILPFCLAIIFPNNFIFIIMILLFSLGLILEIVTLYKIDDLNRILKKE